MTFIFWTFCPEVTYEFCYSKRELAAITAQGAENPEETPVSTELGNVTTAEKPTESARDKMSIRATDSDTAT